MPSRNAILSLRPNSDNVKSSSATVFSNDGGFGYSDPVLWKTDGTLAGTRSLGTAFAGGTSFTILSPSSQHVALPDPVPFNGQAYFFKDNALWVGDGTVGGTVMMKSFASARNTVLTPQFGDNHHPAAARSQRVDSAAKSLTHRAAQPVSQRAQRLRLNANYVAANFIHGREDQPKW